jgi:transposase
VIALAKSKKLEPTASKMYQEGLSIDAVAKELGVTYRTARKAIRGSGVVLRDPSARLRGRTRPDKKRKASS